MKSVFYYMFKSKATELQSLMFRYKDLNIQRENVQEFCKDMSMQSG